jgi:hypothetical protein
LYQNLLSDSSVYQFLVKLDTDLAAQCRITGCRCGGKLHSAKYPRKARGLPREMEKDFNWRHSFCCELEGCRRRSTPPSFRFLGRKVFVAVVVVLVATLRHGATPVRMATLCAAVGVHRRTVERWRRWWQEGLTRSSFWRAARGRFPKAIDESSLPLSLLEAFGAAEPKARVLDLLRFLLPLSGSGPEHAWPCPTVARRRCTSPVTGSA